MKRNGDYIHIPMGGQVVVAGPKQTVLIGLRDSDGDIDTQYWINPGPKDDDEALDWTNGISGREPDGDEGGVWTARSQRDIASVSREISEIIGRRIYLSLPKDRTGLDETLTKALGMEYHRD